MKIWQQSLLACSLIGVSLSTQAVTFNKVLLDQSQLCFVSKQMNVPVEGKFKEFTAKLNFDPAKVEAASAELDIVLSSIDAGSSEANDEVKSKGWFNVQAFPTAKFVAKSVKSLGSDRFEVAGDMSIKGKTNPVTAPFTLKITGKTGVLEGSFPLKRLQFNIGEGTWSDTDTVADEVQIRFKLVVSE